MRRFSIMLVGIMVILSTMFVACTQNEEMEGNTATKESYLYALHMNCAVPGYSEDLATRGSSSWKEGSVVYLVFKGGITGTATFNGNGWTLEASDRLDATSTEAECHAVYVENHKGITPAPTGGSNTSSVMSMSSGSVHYQGDGTYSVASSDIYVNVTLQPSTWRLRFKGEYGTKITLPGEKNSMVLYYKSMNLGTFELNKETEDVSLVVGSNGYTDYIYGELSNKDRENTIYLINESEKRSYYREDLSGKILSVGKSGYLTIPTEGTWASLDWLEAGGQSEIDRNEYGNDSSLDEEVKYHLSVSNEELNFTKDASTMIVEISTNDEWMITSNNEHTWCKYTPASGNQGGAVSISVEKNTKTQSRATELIISGVKSNLKTAIIVTQEPGGETTIDKNGFEDDVNLD